MTITAGVFAQETRDRAVAGMRKVDVKRENPSNPRLPPWRKNSWTKHPYGKSDLELIQPASILRMSSPCWVSRDKIIGALGVVMNYKLVTQGEA